MRVTILVLFAAVCAMYVNAQDDSLSLNVAGCGAGTLQPDNGRVVNGQAAKQGDIPHQIQLFRNGAYICGGSLANQRTVITAAHCTVNYAASAFSIRVGHTSRIAPEVDSITRTCSWLVNHPSYSSLTLNNDISLLRWAQPVTYTAFISPICVSVPGDTFSGNATSSGWGTTSSGGALSNVLLWVSMTLTTDAACSNYYPGAIQGYNPTTMICAGDIGDNTDTCQGDSGGPLAWFNRVLNRWQLIGIVSWGRGCGDIGVYTRVTNYYNWILQQIATNP